jgi:hypothetical protein
MGQKVAEMAEDDLKSIMRAIARANGRPLSDARIDAALPAYRNFMAAIERLRAYEFALEDEPAFHFSLKPNTSDGGKDGSR